MTGIGVEPRKAAQGLFAIVGFLVCVEVASGVLQGLGPDRRSTSIHDGPPIN